VQARCVGLQGIHKGGKSSAPTPLMPKMPCPLASATQGKMLKAAPQGETRTAISLSREGHAPQETPWAYRSFAVSWWVTLHQLVWIVLCCVVCLDVELWWVGCAPLLTFFSLSGANTKCRTINDDDPIEACGPYLSREAQYYFPLDLPPEVRSSVLIAVLDVMRPALSLDCSANLLSLLCHTWFRECREVPHDTLGSTMLPSLMVRAMILES
jgi:hypothetical protein